MSMSLQNVGIRKLDSRGKPYYTVFIHSGVPHRKRKRYIEEIGLATCQLVERCTMTVIVSITV